jgi:hypothetical protein
MREESWFYKNYVPKAIPADLSQLSEQERKALMDNWADAVRTTNSQSTEDRLKNIRDLDRIFLNSVPPWMMDRFKEMIDHYVCGQWLSAIAIGGIIAEYLSFHLLEEYVKSNGIRRVIRHSRKLGRQEGRLVALRELGVLTEEERTKLDLIRDRRNEYVHLNTIRTTEKTIKEDSLKVVSTLTEFLNEHRLSLS